MDAGVREISSRGEVTTSEGFQLLDEIVELCPGAMLILTGGEPLLRRDIFDLAQYAARKKLMVVLGTNGYLVTEEAVKKLVDVGVQGLGISLDSLNPTVHDCFRGKAGSWQRAIAAMELCRKWKLEFQVQTTVTSDNVSEIPSLLELAYNKDARVFNLFFLVCTGRGQQVTDISPIQYEEVLSLVVRLGGQYNGMMVRVRCAPYISRLANQIGKGSSFHEGHVGCLAGTHYCRITPEGEVTPCPYLPASVGNLEPPQNRQLTGQMRYM
jgi:MoaA/NifB/PqqE/SkfB family radical SAM enzyme